MPRLDGREWKEIPEAPRYFVSSKGEIRGPTGKTRKLNENVHGYMYTGVPRDGKTQLNLIVHRAVATAFHGPRPSADHSVDHIDNNKKNNRADNLRWILQYENTQKRGSGQKGERNPMSKLSDVQRQQIREALARGATLESQAAKYRVSPATIKNVRDGIKRGLRVELRRFAVLMELKLRKNDYKGGWSGLNNAQLLEGALRELDELREAIKSGDPVEIALESADVSNYLMMIADNAGGL